MSLQAGGTTVRIQISNLLGGGDYTGVFELGTSGQQVNLLLDTGSSTPAIDLQDFTGQVTPTDLVEHLAYGSVPQGFNGPVVQTSLTIGTGEGSMKLDGVNIVVIPPSAGHPFGRADGILGLAYKGLNVAFDLGTNTVDYYFKGQGQPSQSPTRVPVPTYFTQLEQQGVVPNRFSFYTLRSVPHIGTGDPSSDPLNQGYFIAGGGEEATDLYQGDFTTVKVVDDLYYNTHATAFFVGDTRINIPINYPQNPSNSIVDSGTNGISVPHDLYGQIVQAFANLSPSYGNAIQTGIVGDLSDWPEFAVELQGETGLVRLQMSPDTYWQLNAPGGRSVFAIRPFDPPVILGLPLMNNYYTIFDRAADSGEGVIKFAPIKRP